MNRNERWKDEEDEEDDSDHVAPTRRERKVDRDLPRARFKTPPKKKGTTRRRSDRSESTAATTTAPDDDDVEPLRFASEDDDDRPGDGEAAAVVGSALPASSPASSSPSLADAAVIRSNSASHLPGGGGGEDDGDDGPLSSPSVSASSSRSLSPPNKSRGGGGRGSPVPDGRNLSRWRGLRRRRMGEAQEEEEWSKRQSSREAAGRRSPPPRSLGGSLPRDATPTEEEDGDASSRSSSSPSPVKQRRDDAVASPPRAASYERKKRRKKKPKSAWSRVRKNLGPVNDAYERHRQFAEEYSEFMEKGRTATGDAIDEGREEEEEEGDEEEMVGRRIAELLNSGKVPAFRDRRSEEAKRRRREAKEVAEAERKVKEAERKDRSPMRGRGAGDVRGAIVKTGMRRELISDLAQEDLDDDEDDDVRFGGRKGGGASGKRRRRNEKKKKKFQPLFGPRNRRRMIAFWEELRHAIAIGEWRVFCHQTWDAARALAVSFPDDALALCRSLTIRDDDADGATEDGEANGDSLDLIDPGPLPPPPLPSADKTAGSSAAFLLLSLLATAALSHVACRVVANHAYALLLAAAALLFDLEEASAFVASLPAFQRARERATSLWHAFEDHVLLARRFTGREWDGDKFDFDRSSSQDRRRRRAGNRKCLESLIMRPPPLAGTGPIQPSNAVTAVEVSPTDDETSSDRKATAATTRKMKSRRRGGILVRGEKTWKSHALDGERFDPSVRRKMSEDTVEHMIAVNFCYIMLRSGDCVATDKDVGKAVRQLKLESRPKGGTLDDLADVRKARKGKRKDRTATMEVGEAPASPEEEEDDEELARTRERERLARAREDEAELGEEAFSFEEGFVSRGRRRRRHRRGGSPAEVDAAFPEDDAGLLDRGLPPPARTALGDRHARGLSDLSLPGIDEEDEEEEEDSDDDARGKENGDGVRLSSSLISFGSKSSLDDISSDGLSDADEVPNGGRRRDKNADGGDNRAGALPTKSLVEGRRTGHATVGDVGFSAVVGKEMKWIDVGAKIGMRILNSEHVQRVIVNPDTERRLKKLGDGDDGGAAGDDKGGSRGGSFRSVESGGGGTATTTTTSSGPAAADVSPSSSGEGRSPSPSHRPAKPVHAMWTSAGAAASTSLPPPGDVSSSLRNSLASTDSSSASSLAENLKASATAAASDGGDGDRTGVAGSSTSLEELRRVDDTKKSRIVKTRIDSVKRLEMGVEVSDRGSLRHVEVVDDLDEKRQGSPASPKGDTGEDDDGDDERLVGVARQKSTYAFDVRKFLEDAAATGRAQRGPTDRDGVGEAPASSTRPTVMPRRVDRVQDGRSPSRLRKDLLLPTPISSPDDGGGTTPPTTPTAPRRPVVSPGVKMVVPMFPPFAYPRPEVGRRRSRDPRRRPGRRVGGAGTASSSSNPNARSGALHYQMATVLSSKRIYVGESSQAKLSPKGRRNRRRRGAAPAAASDGRAAPAVAPIDDTEKKRMLRRNRNNCLSITVQLDRSVLRGGKFAEMTLRVMDDWSDRHMPIHSKFPVGSCVATSFGIGVLVGWRVEDDIHVVRSLWQKRGAGAAHAYLNRDALHEVMEAAVGFNVETNLGHGTVLAYVQAGREFRSGRFFVLIKEKGHKGHVLEFSRSNILSCRAATFIPVIEHIKEAAKYRIALDNYKAAILKEQLDKEDDPVWQRWSEGFELAGSSLVKALGEDKDFEEKFVASVISFLEDFSIGKHKKDDDSLGPLLYDLGKSGRAVIEIDNDEKKADEIDDEEGSALGLWIVNDVFGGVLPNGEGQMNAKRGSWDDATSDSKNDDDDSLLESASSSGGCVSLASYEFIAESHKKAFSVIKTLARAVNIARASVPNKPNLQIALSICHEVLLFVRMVVKVQQKNMSAKSIRLWKKTFKQMIAIFVPLKDRLTKIGRGIAERLERQGNKAKVRLLRFVDIILVDDKLLQALELGEWDKCLTQVELACVKANMIDEVTCEQYHRSALFIYNTLAPKESSGAAKRNEEKIATLAKVVKYMASPRRSILKLLTRDDVLDLIERILVRVYRKQEEASRILTIYAYNFHSFRNLRMLNNLAISGKLWMPILDAADEEFVWAVSRMPRPTKEFVEPVSKLFSLGVSKFHEMKPGDLNADWLEFLMKHEAVKMIQELDMKLILGLEAFSHDVKEVMTVLPYYSSIDDDLLNLMDEVDLDAILKEAAEAIVDTDRFANYLREKSAKAVETFLEYLPKMSIPVERRPLEDSGWVLTCRSVNGGDLTLSEVIIEKENVICQVMGGGNVLSPVFGEVLGPSASICCSVQSPLPITPDEDGNVEVSILDHVRELLVNAQEHGCLDSGVGGARTAPLGPPTASALQGLPVSDVLNCAIKLWQNLEIDDDELMEIAIRDVSYQVQLKKERDEDNAADSENDASSEPMRATRKHQSSLRSAYSFPQAEEELELSRSLSIKSISDDQEALNRRRFNPRKDPTVLYLEMNKLTFHLDKFMFRVEQAERSTVFDPVFEGLGGLKIKNVSIKLRVECRKERINKLGREVTRPVLQLQELDVHLDQVMFKFKDTGADWLLNRIVTGFADNITEVVEVNLKEQIITQIHVVLENLNSYIEVNPDLLLSLLGITIDDLEENIVWV